MTLNTVINTFGSSQEQEQLENLVIEYIQSFGMEIYYLPRRRGNFDQLYHDDDMSYFDSFYPIEMYLESYSNYGGEGTFMSKFDIEVRDQITISIARRRFDLEIGSKEDIPAPREGDLIYFPMTQKIFEILFSDNKPFFFQMGTLQMFTLTCELFEYASERFNTGIPAIDVMQSENTQDILEFAIRDADGNYIVSGDGRYLATAALAEQINDGNDDTELFEELDDAEGIVDWKETNPYGENPW